MSTTFITLKANAALQAVAEGRDYEVTRQMKDRLYKENLIDFDPAQGGWFLTDYGWNSIYYTL